MKCLACQHNLSEKNLRIVGMYAECQPMKAIASRFEVSEKTVEHHLSIAMRKLKLPSRLHLVHWALKNKVARFVT